jgi:hypothetical protein
MLARKLSRPPRRQVSETAHIPAPMGGLNAVDAAYAMPATDCVQLFNMLPAENGLRARLGSREWFVGLKGASDDTVRTTFYYHGSAKDGTKDRVFACTSEGIWDVTSSGTLADQWTPSTAYDGGDIVYNEGNTYLCVIAGTSDPSSGPTGTGTAIVDGSAEWDWASSPRELTFGTQTGDAGRGIFHSFITSAGHFLAYCDEANGYQLYTESTDTWAAVTAVTGVDESTFVFVGSWKSRLFFAARDTAETWYLELGAISGAATKLDLTWAAKPRHGGDLVGIYNWTLDGGAGIDDLLVFVFRGGDIAIYQGTSPTAAATFALKGVWYAGALPKGRNVVTPYGGDLLILTKNGVRPLSLLVNGGEGLGQYTTKKISNLFNALMLSKSTIHGWSMHIHPEDNSLVVTHPTTDGANTEQLVMSLVNGGWGRYRDLPIYSAGAGGGKLYFGSAAGKVYINDGYVDGVTLANPNAYSAIQWSVLTAFRNLGNGRQKRVHLIRPTILSENTAAEYGAQARYKFDLTEIASVSGGTVTSDEWDGGVWDTATWAGEFEATQATTGTTGMGVDVAIAVRGTATSRTVLAGIDITFEQGGFL